MNNNNSGNELYAHSRKGEPLSKWQPLKEHLNNVALLAASFAEAFGSGDWAYAAGMLHDLGKADSSFQGYLMRQNDLDDSEYDSGRINHSSAGAALAKERLKDIPGTVLAYIVAGHHAGLPDWDPSETGAAALTHRIDEGKKNLRRIRSYTDTMTAALEFPVKPPSFMKSHGFHHWVRMIYSCIVDADYLDTELFMNPDQSALRSGFTPLSALNEKFDRYMDTLSKKADKTPVNLIRNDILYICREAAAKSPGIFTLTVPTGGGKTLSSMAFAFEHAMKYAKKRIIYVIPFTSIIEQTAAILSEILGRENVIEHHSNFDPERDTQRMRLSYENWDAPIVVTTNVQFFESLYASKAGRCRKLHNINNSIVILDEAQLLPPELLDPCVDVINHLVRNHNVTVVLGTATQPALPGLENRTEIIPSNMNLYQRLKRTEIIFPGDLKAPQEWETIASRLKQHEQVLCVVNSRKDCHELHRLMPEGTIHLSALMCGHHRSRIIRYIKWRLKKGRPVRAISTQLVEAGVDIDFPVVYRAFAGLDSIAQASGRCNREGTQERLGQVHVFMAPRPSPPGILRKAEDTAREMYVSTSISTLCAGAWIETL
ncbi:MAG: CRISPR-associated endonuclease Cas3'' [Vulcanimicrobiota bacterium]